MSVFRSLRPTATDPTAAVGGAHLWVSVDRREYTFTPQTCYVLSCTRQLPDIPNPCMLFRLPEEGYALSDICMLGDIA